MFKSAATRLGTSSRFSRPIASQSVHNVHPKLQLYHFPRPPDVNLHLQVRYFQSSQPHNDIFFVAMPALKGMLLNVTRFSLLLLPFAWKYRLHHKYRRTTMLLIQIPLFAICLVFALGLDQSPRTNRWRLLLMSDHEELQWARRKRDEVLDVDGRLLLPSTDPRVSRIQKIAARLVTALEEQEQQVVSGASWPPKIPRDNLGQVMDERARGRKEDYRPSATAASTFMPFRPETSNPLKTLESADWSIWLIDLPKVNAFALPSKDVFIYTGLLDLVDDDGMLAAVLAHEIAHVTQRHAVENFLNVAAVAFDVIRGVSFALTISFPFITDSAALFINWVNDVVAERAFSRKIEMEADRVGLDFMALAGYDPRSAHDLWDLMGAVEADNIAQGNAVSVENRFALLRTHPPSDVRQEAIKKRLPVAMQAFREHGCRHTSKMARPLEPAAGEQTGVERQKGLAPLAVLAD